MIEIATGYQLVYFVKENEVVEQLSVESWHEKENQWPSISEGITDSRIPPCWNLPENVWVRETLNKPFGSARDPLQKIINSNTVADWELTCEANK